jgi:hypothetical protein
MSIDIWDLLTLPIGGLGMIGPDLMSFSFWLVMLVEVSEPPLRGLEWELSTRILWSSSFIILFSSFNLSTSCSLVARPLSFKFSFLRSMSCPSISFFFPLSLELPSGAEPPFATSEQEHHQRHSFHSLSQLTSPV